MSLIKLQMNLMKGSHDHRARTSMRTTALKHRKTLKSLRFNGGLVTPQCLTTTYRHHDRILTSGKRKREGRWEVRWRREVGMLLERRCHSIVGLAFVAHASYFRARGFISWRTVKMDTPGGRLGGLFERRIEALLLYNINSFSCPWIFFIIARHTTVTTSGLLNMESMSL